MKYEDLLKKGKLLSSPNTRPYICFDNRTCVYLYPYEDHQRFRSIFQRSFIAADGLQVGMLPDPQLNLRGTAVLSEGVYFITPLIFLGSDLKYYVVFKKEAPELSKTGQYSEEVPTSTVYLKTSTNSYGINLERQQFTQAASFLNELFIAPQFKNDSAGHMQAPLSEDSGRLHDSILDIAMIKFNYKGWVPFNNLIELLYSRIHQFGKMYLPQMSSAIELTGYKNIAAIKRNMLHLVVEKKLYRKAKFK